MRPAGPAHIFSRSRWIGRWKRCPVVVVDEVGLPGVVALGRVLVDLV